MCVPWKVLIISHVKYICNNWLNKFYSFSVLAFAINKMDGCGLVNTYQKYKTDAVLVIQFIAGSILIAVTRLSTSTIKVSVVRKHLKEG